VSQVCAMAWERRYDFIYQPLPFSESIEKAKKITSYPVLIVDHGDNTGSGGSADDMSVLAEMLRQGLSGIIVAPIRDPEAVDQLINCGEGNEMTLTVGGKYSVPSINQIGQGLNCTGVVKKITDGCFTITSPVQTGLKVCLGRTVVFDIGPATIIISEEGWEPYGPELFMHGELFPKENRFMLIKSRVHFKAGFESITNNIIMAAGPGVSSSDYSQFNFSRLPKPMFPFDKKMKLKNIIFYNK
jgi:microcystin degradation protein MlrC